ncbi:Serine/threonine-protein kinase YPK1 [Psilocybe cubensis]|nr:Serine/threonine-protein kinase YPK1 [Psilocybe cubensis]KAH9480410.1 Serine/threonine-protein kinase YPK1 [Psilocybe cubensis]
MSWLRSKKASVNNLKADESARSKTPTPSNPDGKPQKRTFRSGLLTIRVMGAEGISMPPGVALPASVQSALSSQQAKVAASVSPSSVNQQRLASRSRGSR